MYKHTIMCECVLITCYLHIKNVNLQCKDSKLDFERKRNQIKIVVLFNLFAPLCAGMNGMQSKLA